MGKITIPINYQYLLIKAILIFGVAFFVNPKMPLLDESY